MTVTNQLCLFCEKGYFVRESWSDNDSPENLYCNNCFRRKSEVKDVVDSERSGGKTLDEENEADLEEINGWWSLPNS